MSTTVRMSSNRRFARIFWPMLLLVVLGCGCNWFKGFAFLLPPPQKTVPAEFAHLQGSVAVVVWVRPETTYDYPHVRLEVASHVADHLAARVRAPITVLDPLRVEQLVDGLGGRVVDPARVGRDLGARFVVYLELLEFFLRDPNIPDLLQGRVRASVTVYDLSDESLTPQLFDLAPVLVRVPQRPTRFTQTGAVVVRKMTYETLAGAVAKKFYDHKEAAE